jgi:hypothetical protein
MKVQRPAPAGSPPAGVPNGLEVPPTMDMAERFLTHRRTH